MIPKVTIVICTAIGWWQFGWLGSIAGFFIGLILCLAIGLLATKKEGGLLPRAFRKQLADNFFIENMSALPLSHIKGMSADQIQQFLEAQVERIARRALLDFPGYEIKTVALAQAGDKIAQEETDPEMQEMLRCLGKYMLEHGHRS